MISEKERKAIDDLFHLQHINTYLDLSKDNFQIKSKTIIDWSKSTETVLNLIEKQQKVANLQEKTIQLMAEELKEITGSCPLDIFDYDLDCENKCEQEIDGKCWAEYFRNKAKESE